MPDSATATPLKALILRTCKADLTSHGGFQWPESGEVVAPDWSPSEECGSGLHGLLWGAGDAGLLDWSDTAKWLVAEIDAEKAVDLGGKVKFERASVVFVGDRHEAANYIRDNGGDGHAIVSGTATAGYRGTATAGDRGTATAGVRGTATAGYRGTATAGDRGTATAGDRGTATAGVRGTATAGYSGTATAGDRGTATAGYSGTATAGDRGTATAGYSGTATAGYRGCIIIEWYDSGASAYRNKCAEVDGTAIKPDTAYQLDDDGNFVEATE